MAICWQCSEEVPESNNYCGACGAPQGEIKEKRQHEVGTTVTVQTLSDGLVTVVYTYGGQLVSITKHNGQQTYEDVARHQAEEKAAAGPAVE